ncbi:MAG: alpha/beta fold hydrolase [Pyrinomonadaceae bacterium]|nr:alpha/beta fold hydrolase [Pyrinomonadaceae bacterium]
MQGFIKISRRLRRVIFLPVLITLSFTMAQSQQQAEGLKIEPYTFKTFDKREIPAELGRFTVPAKRSNPNGKKIELAFVRLKSSSQNPGPPLVILAGGPGSSGITDAKVFYYIFGALLEMGDVVALEQRGVGMSRPYMGCKGIRPFAPDALVSRENMLRHIREAFRPCAEEFRAQGTDFTAYNTSESADDVEDLRKALGAQKINLWGFSYGTHLGLAIIRKHPQSINRAILAGVEGMDDTRKLPNNIQSHLKDVHRLVKQDPEWNKLVPDFLGLMKKVFDQLDKQPMTVEVLNRQTKEKTKVAVGKFALQVMIGIDAGDSKDVAKFPALFYSISKGDTGFLTAETQGLQDRLTSFAPWAMIFPMDCASGATKARDSRIKREAPGTLLGEAINFPWPDICDLWGSPDLGDTYRAPVRSNVPTLFIAGTLDARTPVSNVQAIRKGFSNSFTLIVEGAGHEDVFNPPTTLQVIKEFLAGKPLSATKATHPPLKFVPLSDKR